MKKQAIPFLRHILALSIVLCFAINLFAQDVDISFQNTPIKTVLREITKQTAYNFVYSDALKSLDKRIDIKYSSKNQPIDEVLKKIFEGTGISYSIKDKQIALLSSEIKQGSAQKTGASPTITGVVKDAVSNKPLAGVAVLLKDTDMYAITDDNGAYSISAPQSGVLSFSCLGMLSQDIRVGSKTSISISMEQDIVSLTDVVVTGYQTISRERATGSFGTITARDIEDKLQPNLSSLLEGQVPGLSVNQNNQIEIRGVSTFSASKSPLIVIDGFPVEPGLEESFFRYQDGILENVNPNNIENITVLRDGVAASIYGTRAANGVIVITTKKGKQGAPKLSYKGVFGMSPKPNLANLNKANTSDYIDAEMDLFDMNPRAVNTLTGKNNVSRVNYLLKQADMGLITRAEAEREIDPLRKINYLDQVEKYLYRPELSHQHNISINGGGEYNTYNISANYMGTRQNFEHSSNNRITFDIKDDWKLNSFITLSAAVNLVYSNLKTPTLNPNQNYTGSDVGGGGTSLFTYTSTGYFNPYAALVDDTGNPANLWGLSTYKQSVYNTIDGMKNVDYDFLNDINKERITTTDFQSRINGSLRLNIIKGLNVEFGGSWQRGSYKYQKLQEKDAFNVRVAFNDATSTTNNAKHYLPDGAIVNESRSINENWTVRTQINFNRNFDGTKHRVSAMAGNEIIRTTRDKATLATRVGYNKIAGAHTPVNILDYNSTIYEGDMQFGRRINLLTGGHTSADNRFVSWYGNGSYEYNDRYIVSGSVRLDLTNFFGTDSKYRYKPLWSVGGTWKVSEESFFSVPFINRLNIRASYGVNGNINLGQGPFLILKAGDYNSVSQGVSYSVQSPPNNQLRWEKTQTVNMAFDATLFDNRINISFDYYNKNSSDLLAAEEVDITTGFANITKNVGKIENHGFELTVGAHIISTDDFNWHVSHNFAYNKNKVKEYNVARNYVTSYLVARGLGVNVTGHPADGLWGFRTAPLNETTGAAMIYNAKGDVISSSAAQASDMIYLGTARPKFDLSLTNRFNYKNWELSFMFIAKLGHTYRKDAFTSRNIQNRHVGERWRQPGDEKKTIYPALSTKNTDWMYSGAMDVYTGSASFAKLRDLTLTYTFNKDLLSKIGIDGAKLYFQARNLFTIKAKDMDIDPETLTANLTSSFSTVTDWGSSTLPIPREFFIGLQISF